MIAGMGMSRSRCSLLPVALVVAGTGCPPPIDAPVDHDAATEDAPVEPPIDAARPDAPQVDLVVIVEGDEQLQLVRGFGASSAYSDCNTCPTADTDFITANADSFFDPELGIGLSMLRTRIPSVAGEFADSVQPMQDAIARGVTQIWATAWTPPAELKSNGLISNNPGRLLTQNYQAYANHLRDYVLFLRDNFDIQLYAISPANEPDHEVVTEGCTWTGSELRDFVKNNLGPTLAAADLETEIILSESYQDDCSISASALADTTARGFISVVGTHLYNNEPSPCAAVGAADKEFWQTETGSFESYDPTIAHGLEVATRIHDGMVTAGYNAFHYYWLASDSNNLGLRGELNGVTKRFWAMGNYSKFIRPGFHRYAATATPLAGVKVSAFRDPSTSALVIVAINQSGEPVRLQFELDGFSVPAVVPWETSEGRDLAALDVITIASGRFEHVLPDESVTSFVAQ